MKASEIFTIGHSNHEWSYFVRLLEQHGINCLVDVRSTAFSQRNPQFNKDHLLPALKEAGIVYMSFAEEFGARRTDASVLDKEGKVDFEKVRLTPCFRRGVERLSLGISKGFRIVLMCSESDPLECHRFSMIAAHLHRLDFIVKHILKDGSVKEHGQLENQLLFKFYKKLPQPSLLEPSVTREDQLRAVYRLHNKEVGYSPYEQSNLKAA